MNFRAIKLLALAVICGSSLIGLGIRGPQTDFLLVCTFAVTGIWFIIYWIWFTERN